MKKRIISAIILLALALTAYLVGDVLWIFFVGIVGILSYKEMLDLKESHNPYPPLMKILGVICLMLLMYAEFNGYQLAFGVSYWAIATTILVLTLPTLFLKKYTTKDAFYLIGITIFLGLVFNICILLPTLNKHILIYLFIITIIVDTIGMIIGKLIGRTPLSSISPSKTLEGALAGVLAGSISGYLFYINMISKTNPIQIGAMTVILSITAVFGDLIFSKIKRENNIKDFSNSIPGHGGLLDLLDSVIIIILLYVITINFI